MVKKTGSLFMSGMFLLGQAIPVMSGEPFEFYEQEATVITASRRPQPLREIPAEVEVITQEELRASGALNLWDLMRFLPGMDVIDGRSVDGNRAVVSVRGFPEEFVSKLQVLVDGRSVYTPVTGGVCWQQLPVQVQDIDRIEIVKGPSAALYGSNAALGVINIITKKPTGRREFSGAGGVGNRGFVQSSESFDEATEKYGYRFSHDYRSSDGFPEVGGASSNDFLLENKGNFRGYWTPREDLSLELFAGGSWDRLGAISSNRQRIDSNHHFQMLKVLKEMGTHSSVELLASRADQKSETGVASGGTRATRIYQYDVEATHRWKGWGDRLHITWGGSYRSAVAESRAIFANDPDQESWIWRGFAHQSVRLNRKIDLVLAVSQEESRTGGAQFALKAALLGRLSETQSLRASYSRAPTLPTLFATHVDDRVSQMIRLEGNPNIKPEELESYEAGYRGQFFGNSLHVDTNVFYMRDRKLMGSFLKSSEFLPSPLFTFSFENANGAIARGAETEGRLRFGPRFSLYSNYTVETISDQKGDGALTESTPRHKLNLGGTLPFGPAMTARVNAGYKSGHTITSADRGLTLDVRPYWRLDARLTYSPGDTLEIFIAGQNLTRALHREFPDGLEVPRTFFGGLSLKFSETL